MLKSLLVKNYALIDELEMDLSENLTILTGETGAGKSIILGALGLILGKRADTSVLFEQDKKCVVEGRFWLKTRQLKSFFDDHDLDYEDLTCIRREISKSGKSRAFINDTPVTLNTLRALTSSLVDLHQQQESLELATDDFQLKVIDSLAGHNRLLSDFQDHFAAYKKLTAEIAQLKEKDQKAQQDLDYYQFQLNELTDAQLTDDHEKTTLEEELETLTNAESIKEHLFTAYRGLSDGEVNVSGMLLDIEQQLKAIANFRQEFQQLHDRVESARIELDDAAAEIDRQQQNITFDEHRISEVTDRLNQIYHLEKKHGVQTVTELRNIRDRLHGEVNDISTLSDQIGEKEEEAAQLLKKLTSLGRKLTANRKKAITTFEQNALALLPEVGMPNARLSVNMAQRATPALAGFDDITFYFSANKGHNKQPLHKVASGGELSRVMLIIKSLVAASTALPTLIFDEIDTGISGETARKVGRILKNLSANHQVIAITHLPQIAGKGNVHFNVFKEAIKGKTFTRVKALRAAERTEEIAKMISGDKPTTAAMENAKELLAD